MRRYQEELDALEKVNNSIDDVPDPMNVPASDEPEPQASDEDLMKTLNQIFTPILIMKGFETDVGDKVQEAMSEASVLMENNVIQFDNTARMAQLIKLCAILIHRAKNSHEFQMYQKATEIKRKMSLEMQKSEYTQAKALAQKYLVKVSTTNPSAVARRIATELLPETNK